MGTRRVTSSVPPLSLMTRGGEQHFSLLYGPIQICQCLATWGG